MRWFFLLLLFVNIFYVAWELNREQPQHAERKPLPDGVERIVLLSELQPELTPQAPVTPTSDETGGETRQDMPANVADVQPLEQAAQSGPGPAAVTAPDDSVAVTAAALGDTQSDDSAEEPTGDLCYTLGPFREMETLRVVTREIKDFVIEASFRSREEQEQSMYRVYLKPVGGKAEAKALIEKLVSKNIKDYYIITEGPVKNGISLGYFSDKARANRLARRVRKKGFDPVLEPVFRSYMIYWLDYRINEGNDIPQEIFDRHLDSTAQRLSRSCV